MPKTKIPSPARSQGGPTTPKRKKTRGSRSLCSPALSTASGRLTSLIDQFKDKNMESFALSPLNGRSVLNDNTEIDEPRRKSWWKKLDENSRDVMEVLEDNKLTDANNVIEEFIDIEVLSQEKKNYTLDLPESSDNESINSIVLPQRRLFTQKENQPQKKFGQLIGNRESLAKVHKTNTTNTEKAVNVGTRELFQNKRSKPIFPAALLNISPNKTAADKTKENLLLEPKPQVRNIFGNRPANKRKNMFADFIVSESEDEIPDIQPKVFGFQRKVEQRRISSVSKGRDGSPTSSITTDMEMDDWKLLPSSTMVDMQLEDMVGGNTPIKRARLSKLSEAKESDAGTNTLQTNTTADKTKQSNKSVSSKNKSKASPEIKDRSLNSSRTTRSMIKNTSKIEENINTSLKQDSKANKSQSKKSSKSNELNESAEKDQQSTTLTKSQKLNKSKTRSSQNAIENEIETDEIIFNPVNVINNVTRVLNKSTGKNTSNSTVPNKSVHEKERTVTIKVHDKPNANDVEQNDQDDDENNFTLEYENDENEIIEEAVAHNDLDENQTSNKKQNTSTLDKDNQETKLNKSRKNKSSLTNKSIQKEPKPVKTVEESVESQNEQYSTDDNVDGPEQKLETGHNKTDDHEEIIAQEIEGGERNDTEENAEANMNQVSLENEAERSQHNDDELNVNQDNEEVHNVSAKEANESQEAEDEDNESEEDEDEAIESNLNEEDANESQEVEVDENESQEIDDEANESHEIELQVNEYHIEEDNDGPDEEEDDNEDEEKTANESQDEEGSANNSHDIENEESQEVENDEEEQEIENDEEEDQVENDEESQEVENDEGESDAEVNESEEIEDDQQMEDSDEADKAIASDPEISDQDDDQADEMEVDDDQEQESEHDKSAQSQHESQEERQIEEEQNEIEPSAEEIGESPNATHDTTGRHRKKNLNKSPEVILHEKTNQMDSFTGTGRNTSIRKTKSMIKNLHIRPSLAPPRNSTGLSDGTTNSSAEGSGWDSHRTTRKTLRQTFGKDFTPRKSLRAMVMEKSVKRQTEHIDTHSETVKYPQANSTELPEDSNRDVEDFVESDHEVSRRTRQTTLEMYLQKIKQQNIEKNRKMEEFVRNSLKKGPVRDPLSLFKVPNKPAPRKSKPAQSKPKKKIKSVIAFDDLPSEIKEDMKYKPPKRFQPPSASWITKRLYKFLENKLEPKYDYKARIRAEKLVETIYHFVKDLRRHQVAPTDAVDVLKHEFARLEIVRTHFEFYEFFHEFMPREVRIKVNPDIVNKIPLPRHGVFSEILRGNTG